MSITVPHCKDCDRCKIMDFGYTEYYCCKENEETYIVDFLGTQPLPNTSPEWCPKRDVDKVSERGEIELWAIN